MTRTTRRDLLSLPALAFGTALAAAPAAKRVAAVVTEYRHWSHADVICGRLLGGYSANNAWTPPRTRLVSLHTVQTPATDMSHDLAARHGFRRYPSIKEALTLGGGRLAVDAVVFVGEHGTYPFNADGQHLYPRYELFSEILDVYEASGRGVPTFFDKHLSYDWDKAQRMFARVRRLGAPFMAGSSIPVTLRRPSLQPDPGTPMTEVACVGHGPLDAYGFHLLEGLQCLVERRAGGETGVAEVEWVAGDAIWRWCASPAGQWSRPLLEAAHALDPTRQGRTLEQQAKEPVLFRIQYRDGLRAAALMLTPSGNDRTIAIRVPGREAPMTTLFGPPTERPLPHFDGLVRCIEDLFVTGREPYPPERTLLTTGVLAMAFESKRSRAARPTPELNVAYRPPRDVFVQTA